MLDLLDVAIAKNDYAIYTMYTSSAMRVTDIIKNNPGNTLFAWNSLLISNKQK